MASEMFGATLSGIVEVDGVYVGGYVKRANWKNSRKDMRLARNQTGKRQVIVEMRQRGGKTLVSVHEHESQAIPTICQRVELGTIIHADEASHFDVLSERYRLERINHSECYSDGIACTNWAENFNAPIRRMEKGCYHHIAGRYLLAYAEEAAWRENNSRISNGEKFLMLTNLALTVPASAQWTGYSRYGTRRRRG